MLASQTYHCATKIVALHSSTFRCAIVAFTSVKCSAVECITLHLCYGATQCTTVESEPVMAVLELFPATRPPDGTPVEDVEEEEEHWEDDEEGQVSHLTQILLRVLSIVVQN